MSALKWWLVSAGTPDGGEGERRGLIRATSKARAEELYLSQRPATWVIHDIRETEPPQPRDTRAAE